MRCGFSITGISIGYSWDMWHIHWWIWVCPKVFRNPQNLMINHHSSKYSARIFWFLPCFQTQHVGHGENCGRDTWKHDRPRNDHGDCHFRSFLIFFCLFISSTTDSNYTCPLVNKHSYWKWPFIVDLPIKMVIFHSYVIYIYIILYIYMVGGLNPSEKYEFVSWDDDISNICMGRGLHLVLVAPDPGR